MRICPYKIVARGKCYRQENAFNSICCIVIFNSWGFAYTPSMVRGKCYTMCKCSNGYSQMLFSMVKCSSIGRICLYIFEHWANAFNTIIVGLYESTVKLKIRPKVPSECQNLAPFDLYLPKSVIKNPPNNDKLKAGYVFLACKELYYVPSLDKK